MTVRYCDFCGAQGKPSAPAYDLQSMGVDYHICYTCNKRLEQVIQNKEWKPKDDVDGER